MEMGLNSLNNAVKSPMQNNLASPPNINVSKAVSTSSTHMNNDILNVAYSSIGTSSAVSNSSIFSTGMSVANPMNKPMTSQALKNNGNANIHLLNGPHVGLGTAPGLQRGVATTMGMPNLQATLSQSANMLANTTMSINSVAAGQLPNNQLDLNHPMNSAQPQMVQVSYSILFT